MQRTNVRHNIPIVIMMTSGSKCMPVLLYALDSTSNIEIVQDCRVFFKFKLPSEILILVQTLFLFIFY